MNPVVQMCTGWGSDEALGRDIKECYVTRKEGGQEESGIDARYELLSRTGASRTIEEVWSPITEKDSAEADRVLVFRDVTEKRFLERRMRQAQKLESLGALAGGIAHDFNNLLTIVLWNAELVQNEIPPVSPVRGSLAEITTAAQRGADLSARMLAYAGKAVWAVERVGLRELVEELTPMLQASISKKAVLNLRMEEGLPPIKADPSQIRQIVEILVVNASEAIGDRSGVITVSVGATRCDEEYLRTTETHDVLTPGLYVHLEVADDGAGMDAETRARIFEPFFSTKFVGRGLGLAAVLGVVRACKGALKVWSEPGKGTTFKVFFPAAGNKEGAGPMPPAHGN